MFLLSTVKLLLASFDFLLNTARFLARSHGFLKILFFTFSDAICSPPRIRTASNIWKGSGYVQPGTDEKIVLPGGTGNNALFWPFFGAKSGRHRQRSSHRHLRTRWLKNVTSMSDLSAIPMTIHSGKV